MHLICYIQMQQTYSEVDKLSHLFCEAHNRKGTEIGLALVPQESQRQIGLAATCVCCVARPPITVSELCCYIATS